MSDEFIKALEFVRDGLKQTPIVTLSGKGGAYEWIDNRIEEARDGR